MAERNPLLKDGKKHAPTRTGGGDDEKPLRYSEDSLKHKIFRDGRKRKPSRYSFGTQTP
jgi:hypothetical protein